VTLICAYDTETTGIDEPNLVEVGAVLIDDHPDGPFERAVVSLIVRPDGWEIPQAATRVHGISHALALAAGVPLIIAVSALTNLWACAAVRVAHNLEFDDRVIRRAVETIGRPSTVVKPPAVCTKDLAAPILNLPPTERMIATGFGGKPKSPSLRECYRFFFDEDPPNHHSALADARAAARVYLRIKGDQA
jgi:DNA polymerase-3 subunit epsilon